jgi:uncharacterized membrane protein YcaP (DUF421 family)
MEPTWLNNMFVLAIPVIEKIVRPILVYLFLIIGLRLAGKRELAQLNPFDLVVLLTLSNTVQNAIIGNDTSLSGGLIGAATLLATNYLVVRFIHGNRKVEQLMEGKQVLLIENGKLDAERLNKESIDQVELEIAAHKQGFSGLEEIQTAILDPGGAISFIPKESQPDGLRHKELMNRLAGLETQISELTRMLESRRSV